ncbi:unnamed protein product [Rotaria sp. Silwood2]|nr:unnamed protein product [Rotaria sp. Silwood2]CAF4568754.1 unnamed protein product [Rotaria sp. Silwood2]
MGVKYLWSILEPACKQGSYDDLAGKTAAVDLSIWIIECRSVSTNHRNSLHLSILFDSNSKTALAMQFVTFMSLIH